MNKYIKIAVIILALVIGTSVYAASVFTVPQGGTGAATFNQGWIYSPGGTNAVAGSSSPTVNYITATSSTIASTLPYASSTAVSATTVCLTGDVCRTAWPVGRQADWNQQLNYNVLSLTPTTTIPVWVKDQFFASSSAVIAGSATASTFIATSTTATSTFAQGFQIKSASNANTNMNVLDSGFQWTRSSDGLATTRFTLDATRTTATLGSASTFGLTLTSGNLTTACLGISLCTPDSSGNSSFYNIQFNSLATPANTAGALNIDPVAGSTNGFLLTNGVRQGLANSKAIMSIKQNNSNVFTFSTYGFLGIGSTTPTAPLSVQASSTLDKTNPVMLIASSSLTYLQVAGDGTIYAPSTASSGANQTGYWCYDGNGQFIRDTTTCLVSALKFKKDIKPLTLGLNEVLKMEPVTYYKKNPFDKTDSGQQIGFIADNSESIVPQLVSHDSKGDVHGFNYEQYTAVLTKAIQQQQKQIDELKKEVKSLKK